MELSYRQKIVLSMLIGDGYISKEGRFTVDHGLKQEDYLFYKKKILDSLYNVNLKPYFRANRATKSIYLDRKLEFLPLRNLIYLDKKRIPEILKLLDGFDKSTILFYWLCDDAAINRSGIKLCICDSNEEDQDFIIDWFKRMFKVHCYIRYEKHGGKEYPFLIFHQLESMVLFTHIKDYVFKFESMRHKFRNIIIIYNTKYNSIEYNLPTKPRVPKVLKRNELNYTDEQVIEKYNFTNSVKRTSKMLNCTESIIKIILIKNKSLHKKGFKRNVR